jgi:hypothetical protein
VPSYGDRIVAYARDQLGDPYRWGAEGPDSFDCSGLVYAAYRAAGLSLPRTTAAALGKTGETVRGDQAVPGDLVYFDNPGATDHVGIYIGAGQMIEAPKAGVPVRVANVAGRNPTSFRHLPGVDGTAGTTGLDTTSAGLPKYAHDTSEDGLLGMFSSWQNDVQNIGMKIAAGAAVVCLLAVAAKTTFQGQGTA